MNEKMYKASDVIGILLEEITYAEFLRVAKRLSDIPSVVRCKDCRHWWLPLGAECLGVCQLWDLNTDYDFFCKDGEREDNEDCI